MTNSIALALVTTVCYGINDVLFKKVAQAGARPHQVMMVTTLVMVPLTLLYALFTRSLVPSNVALLGSLGAVFSYAGFYLFTVSLRTGAVSVAAPVFRLQFVIAALLALWLLGETMSAIKAAGFLCAVIAIWLLLGGAASTAMAIPGRMLAVLIAATASIGIALFLFKLALTRGASTGTILTYQIVTLAAISSLAAVVMDRGLRVSTAVRRTAPGIGAIQTIGFVAMIEALAQGDVSVITPIAQLSFVIAAVLGILLLRERASARKLAGLASAVGAVVLIAWAAGGKPDHGASGPVCTARAVCPSRDACANINRPHNSRSSAPCPAPSSRTAPSSPWTAGWATSSTAMC